MEKEAAMVTPPLTCHLAIVLSLCGSLGLLPKYSRLWHSTPSTPPGCLTQLSYPQICSPSPMLQHSAPTCVFQAVVCGAVAQTICICLILSCLTDWLLYFPPSLHISFPVPAGLPSDEGPPPAAATSHRLQLPKVQSLLPITSHLPWSRGDPSCPLRYWSSCASVQ